jgi:hypothetical protein
MRCKGITYDTGFFPGGRVSRPSFDPAASRSDMAVIAGALGCDAVRITGGDLERIATSARDAADAGLEVWVSPFPCDLGPAELRPVLQDAAELAAELRRAGAEVALVLGCELSLFAKGFLPGDDDHARLQALMNPSQELLGSFDRIASELNALLADAAADARRVFDGPVTYAAGPWEPIDWAPFDVVATDAYRDASNAAGYRDQVRALTRHGKPAVVTEFGCCTFRGAADAGALGWTIVRGRGDDRAIDGEHVRDEAEQARYLLELLAIFEQEGIDSAFWFTFASFDKPRREDPRRDLDLGSYGVVAVLEDDPRPWVRKASFEALAGAAT